MDLEEEKQYKMYVCLPYLNLEEDKPIDLGPIRFYPSTSFDEFVHGSGKSEIKTYLQQAPDIKRGACICIHPSVPEEDIPELLVDAIYLLYFGATYQEMFQGKRAPLFSPLTKFVPAGEADVKNQKSIDSLKSLKVNHSQVVRIGAVDHKLCNGLGKLLDKSYLSNSHNSIEESQNESRRIIRAVRYFIHCFYEKFENLLGTGIHLKEKVYEPEDFLFLVAAFETLFDLHPDHPNSDLKQKLRPILHVKFGTPLETIWKWIDGFFEIKELSVHEGSLPEGIFKANESFEIPYFAFAVKLFIYSVYFHLYQLGLVPAEKSEKYTPIKFPTIKREEVALFLWPEATLLRKISIILMQITHGRATSEYLFDLSMLANTYQQMLKYSSECPPNIQFKPIKKSDLKPIVEAIVNLSDEKIQVEDKTIYLQDFLPEGFLSTIEKRIA